MKLSTCLLFLSAVSAIHAATLTVNNMPFQPACPAQYQTIQAAVTAANPGDTVYVCKGSAPYNQQVTINKQLTLAGQSGTVLRPAPMAQNTTSLTGTPIAAAILVTGATGVIITNLIVDGSGNGIGGCSPDLIGIYYKNASGTLAFNAIREFRLGPGLEGCQSGDGLFVQSGSGGQSAVTAYANSISRFQKNGITANEAGTNLTAANNVVTGWGPTPLIAQNGIQIGFGARGTISGNTVTNMVYTPCVSTSVCDWISTGILIYQPDASVGVTTYKNNVGTTQTGVYYYDVVGGTISTNNIWNTLVWDGVAVQGTSTTSGSGNTVEQNTITDSGEAAVWANTDGNTVRNNTLNEAPVGIWFVSGSGNTQTGNKFYNIPLPVQIGAGSAARRASSGKSSPSR